MNSIAARTTLAAGLIAAAIGLAVQAQAPPSGRPGAAPPPPAPQVVKMVKPGLFMVTGGGGNVTVRLTSDGMIVVDSKNPGQNFYDDLMGRIHSVSGNDVKWVILTHHHADHSGNGDRFIAAGAKVIANKNLSAELDKFTPPANNPAAIAPAKPSQTFDARYTVKLGGKSAELRHFAPGHTDGDTIVWFPDLKVISTGDEFVATSPNIDYPGGASIKGWIRSLDEVQKLDWDTAIPGHGDNPMTRADLIAFQGKLKTLLSRAQDAVKAGKTKDTLMSAVKTDDLWNFAANFWNPVRLAGLYAEAGGK